MVVNGDLRLVERLGLAVFEWNVNLESIPNWRRSILLA